MARILSYLISLGIAAAIYSTSIVDNGTYQTLVIVVVWAVILLGLVVGILNGIFLFAISFLQEEIPSKVLNQWKKIDKPKLWISIPLIFLWLGALVSVKWTVTAVVYLFESTLLLIIMHLMATKVGEADTEEEDLINYIKDPTVRKSLDKARKKRNKE